jgi:hypothetical protein
MSNPNLTVSIHVRTETVIASTVLDTGTSWVDIGQTVNIFLNAENARRLATVASRLASELEYAEFERRRLAESYPVRVAREALEAKRNI